MRADFGLGQQRQAAQIGQRPHGGRIEPLSAEAVAVVRHMPADVDEEVLQAIDLQRLKCIGTKPLGTLKFLAPRHAIVALELLVQGEQRTRDEAGIGTHADALARRYTPAKVGAT